MCSSFTLHNQTTLQGLLYANNKTLNSKGADAWVSTLNPLLDLFVTSIKKCPDSFEEFQKIFCTIQNALKEDPKRFIKILKFIRLIEKGNGIKWLYYLCMLVIKLENPHLYDQILDWSWQYPKDFMNLHRITNMLEPIYTDKTNTVEIQVPSKGAPKGTFSNKLNAWVLQNSDKSFKSGQHLMVPIQSELILYANKLKDLFINLLTPGSNSDYNPMFLKYMSYESGHWEVETHLIWLSLEELLGKNVDFIELIKSESELETTLGMELRDILAKSLDSNNSILFTNKTRRLIKKCFNSQINLLDNLFTPLKI